MQLVIQQNPIGKNIDYKSSKVYLVKKKVVGVHLSQIYCLMFRIKIPTNGPLISEVWTDAYIYRERL